MDLKNNQTVTNISTTSIRSADNPHALLLETVEQNASNYPRQVYKRAIRARNFQNIIMRPGVRQLSTVAIKHLKNCPVTKADIDAAEHIFGPNLGSLKGKTTRKMPRHVLSNIDPVPTHILRHHSRVALCIDIMYIHKITFLCHHFKESEVWNGGTP